MRHMQRYENPRGPLESENVRRGRELHKELERAHVAAACKCAVCGTALAPDDIRDVCDACDDSEPPSVLHDCASCGKYAVTVAGAICHKCIRAGRATLLLDQALDNFHASGVHPTEWLSLCRLAFEQRRARQGSPHSAPEIAECCGQGSCNGCGRTTNPEPNEDNPDE